MIELKNVKVIIEQLRRMLQAQQSSSANACSVSKKTNRRSGMSSFSGLPISLGFRKLGSILGFRNKDDDKTVASTFDDDCMLDPTEDNTSSVGSEEYLEQTAFAEQASVAFFTDNRKCSSAQLHNRRLLNMHLILDPPKNKKEN
jgi:hypothetical protein